MQQKKLYLLRLFQQDFGRVSNCRPVTGAAENAMLVAYCRPVIGIARSDLLAKKVLATQAGQVALYKAEAQLPCCL